MPKVIINIVAMECYWRYLKMYCKNIYNDYNLEENNPVQEFRASLDFLLDIAMRYLLLEYLRDILNIFEPNRTNLPPVFGI